YNGLIYPNIIYKLKNHKLYPKNYGNIFNYSISMSNSPHWYNSDVGKIINNDDGTFTSINSRSWNGYSFIIPLIIGEKYKLEVEAKRISGNGGSITYYFDNLNDNIEIPNSYNITNEYQVFTDIRKIEHIGIGKYPYFTISFPNGNVIVKSIKIEQLGDYLYLRNDNSVIFTSKNQLSDKEVLEVKYNIHLNPILYLILIIILLSYPIYKLYINLNFNNFIMVIKSNIILNKSKYSLIIGLTSSIIILILYLFSFFSYKNELYNLELLDKSRLGYVYRAKLNFNSIFANNILYSLDKNNLSFVDTNNIKYGYQLDIRRKPDWFGNPKYASIDYNYSDDGYIASNSTYYNTYNIVIPLNIGDEYKVSIEAKKIVNDYNEKNNSDEGLGYCLDNVNRVTSIKDSDKLFTEYKVFSDIRKINSVNPHPSYPQIYFTFSSGNIAIKSIKIEEVSSQLKVNDDNYIFFTSKNMIDNITIKYNIIFNKVFFLILFIILVVTLLIVFDDKIYNYSFNIKEPIYILIISSLVLSILSSIFITTSLIASSPTEFNYKFLLITDNLLKFIGIFLVYPIIIYLISSTRIKKYIIFFMISITIIALINVFIMKGNYGNITNDLKFDNSYLLISSTKQNIMNISFAILSVLITIIIFHKKLYKIIANIFVLIFISLLIISCLNIYSISNSNKVSNSVSNTNITDNSSIFNLSRNGKNIFVILLDRAIPSYWSDILTNNVELSSQFEGFTFYINNTSFAWNTIVGAPVIMGGYEYTPYEITTNAKFNLRDKHKEAILMLPKLLLDYDYKSVVYNPAYPNFTMSQNISMYNNINTNILVKNIDSYVDLYELINQHMTFLDGKVSDEIEIIKNSQSKFFMFSILKIIPIFFRYDLYNNMNLLNNQVKFLNESITEYAQLLFLPSKIQIYDDGNYYNFMHNYITHKEQYFNSDYLPSYEAKEVLKKDLDIYKDEISVRHYYVNMASINLMTNFLNYLKKNNIYDNTKIIIVSDHGMSINKENQNANSKFINLFHSLLLVKDFNSREDLIINTNFMTIADVPYLVVKDFDNPINPFTGKLITNDYKTNGVNVIKLKGPHPTDMFTNGYNFTGFYKVKDNVLDYKNWQEFIYNK
ncbi:hypothetical protein, partial [Brachyspira pulli]|uniref:hypothetical protein n=1 Tax=Brachyspira pulli TaxID=310721 RepID=UPI0030068753